jgi:glycosyltransferase involved in cell wall biosynthesis
MRILHVVPSYLPAVRYGGPIFAVHGLCRALVTIGHRVEVFTTNVDGPRNSPVSIDVPVDMDGVIIRYFSCPSLRRLYWAPAMRRALARDIGQFDLVHLHSVFLWPTWAAARAARKHGVRYVISPRGMLVKDLIRRRSRLVKTAWIRLIEKSNIEHAAAVHVTSQLEANELERFNWHLPHVPIIPNGIEPQTLGGIEISADINAVTKQQPLVLFLGRLSWKKGLDRLLHAFAGVSHGHLAIVGTDDEGLSGKIVELSEQLRIADRVHVLPRTVNSTDKERLFNAARLFVLPSYSENFGNTILEAFQHRVPVVATPEVGAADIVQRSGGGLVVSGDPAPLGEAICRLLSDPERARSMGVAGQQYSAAHHTWVAVARRMESLYEGLRT